jgi:hypothetical protein
MNEDELQQLAALAVQQRQADTLQRLGTPEEQSLGRSLGQQVGASFRNFGSGALGLYQHLIGKPFEAGELLGSDGFVSNAVDAAGDFLADSARGAVEGITGDIPVNDLDPLSQRSSSAAPPVQQDGATPLAQPAAQAVPAALPPIEQAGATPIPQFDLAAYQALAAQEQALLQSQLQAQFDVDALNRAQAASALITTPTAQFTNAQALGNAALAANGVPSSITGQGGALAALQQLKPESRVQSVQPAINASANQSQRVNGQVQGATAEQLRQVQRAQELQLQLRNNFKNQVVLPILSRPRN